MVASVVIDTKNSFIIIHHVSFVWRMSDGIYTYAMGSFYSLKYVPRPMSLLFPFLFTTFSSLLPRSKKNIGKTERHSQMTPYPVPVVISKMMDPMPLLVRR